jgi:putative membrane protein insertion efficiency factor
VVFRKALASRSDPLEAARPRPAAVTPSSRDHHGRYRALAVLFIVLALGSADLARSPDRQWSAAIALGGIHFYQAHISSWMPFVGIRCRFEPTCSHYAEESIRRHGALIGGWRAFKRVDLPN